MERKMGRSPRPAPRRRRRRCGRPPPKQRGWRGAISIALRRARRPSAMRRWLRLARWQPATLAFAVKRNRGPALGMNLYHREGDFQIFHEGTLQQIGFPRQTGESLIFHHHQVDRLPEHPLKCLRENPNLLLKAAGLFLVLLRVRLLCRIRGTSHPHPPLRLLLSHQ